MAGQSTGRTKENEMTTETTTHLHDLGITISVPELEAEQLATMRTLLMEEIAEVVRRFNAETSPLTGATVHAYVSYDGAAECGEHR
jgi:hypothetical protein